MIYPIVIYGDEVLRKPCAPVTPESLDVKKFEEDMFLTLEEAGGVGLAAPQVGILRRVVLVLETNVPEGEDPYIIELINPEIVESSGSQNGPEGCLSVPGRFGLVERPMDVTVRAQDRNGNSFEVKGHELTARAFCHELDHLEGKMFTQCASRMLTDEELESGSWNDEVENA